jgi:ribonuclease-3
LQKDLVSKWRSSLEKEKIDRVAQTKREKLQHNIGYTFRDLDLLETALTHPSYQKDQDEPIDHYERLEFLGDSVLDLILAEDLFHRYPNEREGFLGQSRSILARGNSLTQMAKSLELHEFIRISRAEERNNGRKNESTLENALEAVIGAIFLDSNYPTTRSVVLSWFGHYTRELESTFDTINPKGNLQEAIQAQSTGSTIEYRLLDSSGPEHRRTFKVAVFIDGKRKGTGMGNSKKKAEEAAAKKALPRVVKVEN